MPVNQGASSDECARQIFRNDDAAQTQRRENRLAECADVNHSAVSVESLQRCEWSPRVPVLAVVIVFDDESVGPFCPFEQRQAARKAHRNSKRKLVRWRYVNESRPLVALNGGG